MSTKYFPKLYPKAIVQISRSQMTTPWQFGTKDPHTGRQIDTHLNVTCRD